MGLAAGIVGLPNIGKSTIFNALTSGKAAAENYPFCTIDPNVGIVAVPDKRLTKITELIPSKKVVPAFLELVDIAGLVKGASQGEGLGNQFLGHIKNMDAIVHVVRCFVESDVIHVDGSVDPTRDIGTIETELMMADLSTVEKGFSRVEKLAKTGDKEAKLQVEPFRKAKEALERGIPVRKADISPEEHVQLSSLHLLTSKPVLYVANVDEDAIHDDNDFVTAVRKYAATEGSDCIKICGKVESEIAELPPQDRADFLESVGLAEPGLNSLTRAIYVRLGLETYFTAGAEENRAWTIHKNFTAPQAAGVIHTDFEKGFIRAEVYTFDDLVTYKTEAAIKAAGKMRSEGKEYIVKDGDMMFFKFNV